MRDVLSSQAVTHQVLSTLKGLTSVFGMGTGVPLLLSSRNLSALYMVYIFSVFLHPFSDEKRRRCIRLITRTHSLTLIFGVLTALLAQTGFGFIRRQSLETAYRFFKIKS